MKSHESKKVLVFGAFDGLHEGHIHFLNQAKKHGGHITIALALDQTIEKLKKHPPTNVFQKRIEELKKIGLANTILSGDLVEGSWEVLKKHQPEIICLGYDQKELRNILERDLPLLPFIKQIIIIDAHQPDKFHSSILRNR